MLKKENTMTKTKATTQAKDVQPRVEASGQVVWFRVGFVGVLIEQKQFQIHLESRESISESTESSKAMRHGSSHGTQV